MMRSTVTLDEKKMKQYANATVRPGFKILLIVLCAIYTALAVSDIFYDGDIFSFVKHVLAAVILASILPLRRSVILSNFKQRTMAAYGVPEETLSFELADDSVSVLERSGSGQVRIPYEGIASYTETEDMIILFSKTRRALFVSKDDISKDELFEFLRTKPTAIKKLK